MSPIDLTEWEEIDLPLTEAQAQAMADHPAQAIAVSQGSRPGHRRLRVGAQVGSLHAGGLDIRIRPKIAMENVLALMDVPGLDNMTRWSRALSGFALDPHLFPGLVPLFNQAVLQAIGPGVQRSYESRQERLIGFRGRLDVRELVRRPGVISPVPCVYDDHTADIPANRLLKAAIIAARRLPRVPREHQHLLRRHQLALDGVSVEPPPPDWFRRWQPTRLDERYEAALCLATLLLERSAVSDRRGELSATSFLVDMNRLFEAWVHDRLSRALSEELSVEAQYPTHLGEDRRVAIYPDLVFSRDGRVVFVADIKYKRSEEGADARTADYYQALTYATVLGIGDAALVHARDTDNPARQDELRVQNSPVRLHSWSLDLRGDAASLEGEARRIAKQIEARCAPRPLAVA